MIFAILSGILAFAFYLDVFLDAKNGRIKPNPASWFIWSLNDSLILAASWSVGAVNTLFVPGVYALFGWAILFITVKNNFRKLNQNETICLVGSILSWFVYFFTTKPFLSLVLGVVVNVLGTLPTIFALWRNPASESLRSWALLLLASLFSIISVENLKIELVLFPISSMLLVAAINLLILRGYPKIDAHFP